MRSAMALSLPYLAYQIFISRRLRRGDLPPNNLSASSAISAENKNPALQTVTQTIVYEKEPVN